MLFGKSYQILYSSREGGLGAQWCSKCLIWGHPDRGCRNSVRCGWCGGAHPKSMHRAACHKCCGSKTEPPTPDHLACPHSPWCPNCKEQHPADGEPIHVFEEKDGVTKKKRVQCPFWLNRFNKGWYLKRYEKVCNDHKALRDSVTNKPLVTSPHI